MIYAIINQCIILIRIIFSMYSCLTPPIYDYCWNHSFILAHLFHYKSLDINIVFECSLRCHYPFRLITKYKIRKTVTAKQSSQKKVPVTSVSHFKNVTFSFTVVLRKVLKVTVK